MAKKLHLVHVKSNVLDKAPSASTINYGEIAVNYNADSPALYIRDDDDNIVKFISEPYFEKIVGTGITENESEVIIPISEVIQQDEEVVAAALNDLNDRKADKSYVDEAVSGITIDVDTELDTGLTSTNPVENRAITKVILDNEEAVAAALNDLNDRIDSFSIDVDTELDSASTNPVENQAVTNALFDVEETVAASLNDLNDRKADISYVDEAVSSITIDIDSELDSASTNPVENQAITNALFDVEETVAAALNDLNDRKADISYVEEAVSSITIDVDSELDSASTNPVENRVIYQTIVDNEETIAAALNDLNDRKADKDYVDEAVSSITIDVDSELDSASTNPVENRVLYQVIVDSASTNPVQNQVITNVILDNEEATSAALNDLNGRINDANSRINTISETIDDLRITIDDEIESGSTNPVQNGVIWNAFREVELVAASALNDLNDKIAITGVTETGSGNAVTGVTVNHKVLTVAKGNISGGGGGGSVGTLNTTATSAQATSSSESFENNITLHKISKTGNYNDLLNKPAVITGVTINSAAKTVTNGVVDLGTVVTEQTSVSTGASGNGNVLTNITLGGDNNHTLTLVKGMTIPTWATSSTKPSYTANEVGAMASNATLDNVPDGTTRKLSNYISGATMNGSNVTVSNGKLSLGDVVTAQTQLSTGTTQGSGNVVTSLAVSNHQITLTKGITIPDWATASTKPSYTASEVGALPTGTTLDNVADGTTRKLSNYATTATVNTLSNTVTAHTADTTVHVTTAEKSTWNGKANTSDITITGLTVGGTNATVTNKVAAVPTASTSTFGVVKVGNFLSNSNGTISVSTGTTSLTVAVGNHTHSNYATTTNLNTHTGTTISGQMHLPTVSASDNGKILRVVNGAWALVDPATIYYGSGTPAQSLGNDGDIYIQTS